MKTPIAPPISAAEPDQPGAGEDVAEQVVGDLVVVLEDEVEPGADQAAEQGREGHLVGPVHRLAELAEALPDQRPGREEGEREADPEGLQGERAELDLGLHGGRLAEAA